MNSVKSAPDFTGCEYWGNGGQYIFDPARGKRTRVGAPTAAPEPASAVPVTDNQAAEQVADNKKGKHRD